MIPMARQLAETHGWFFARQFENPSNPSIHERTTAVEILRDFRDVKLDYFVTGYGTGGTLQGVSKVLAKESPDTKIIVTEPDTAQLMGSHIPQGRNADGTPSQPHSAWAPHVMQGWTPDFIPLVAQQAMDLGLIDEIIPVNGPESIHCSQALATQEGIFVGISGGATFAAALKVAEKAAPGSNILCMLPDTGERYLSTPLFENVPAEMTEEEHAIARSVSPGQ